MGSSSREDEAARALERGGGIGKTGGGSGSRSRKKTKKAVFPELRFHSRDTCSIGGASILGWQASWAGVVARRLGPAGRPRPGGGCGRAG
jgi:hypothetical protein